MRTIFRLRTTCLLLLLTLFMVGPELGLAKDPGLLTVGPRVGVDGDSPLGEEQKENFQLYDIAATFLLPWMWQSRSGWDLEMRLIASAGELRAAGESGFMGTVVPALALCAFDGRLALDAGLGAGLFSNYTYGVQDFGGPVQIILTMGIGFKFFEPMFSSYRFQHFSDATLYGDDSLGADMHILEVSYTF